MIYVYMDAGLFLMIYVPECRPIPNDICIHKYRPIPNDICINECKPISNDTCIH